MIAWFKANPIKAVLRTLFVLVNFILGGAAGYFFAFGPLSLAAPWPVIFGIVAAVFSGAYWALQQKHAVSGNKQRASVLRNRFVAALATIFIAAGAVALYQGYFFGQFVLGNVDRMARTDDLARAIQAAYPYFEEKGLDWREIYQTHRPKIASAKSDEEYYLRLSELLAELGDGHTAISEPWLFNCCFAMVRPIEGKPVVVASSPSTEQAGLVTGSIILRTGGNSIDLTKDFAPAAMPGSHNPRQREYLAAAALLAIPESGELDVEFLSPQGEVIQTRLKKVPQPDQPSLDSGAIQWKQLESGYGYIQITRLWNRQGEDLVSDFDRALDALKENSGLILDLRANGGGNSLFGDAIAGRFLDRRYDYGYERYPARLFMRAWTGRMNYFVAPRPPIYTGRLVVLIDEGVVSSAEQLVAALGDSGRAYLIGRNTGGSSGNPIRFNLSEDTAVRFSTGAFYRINGQPLEWRGIPPDKTVNWTITDVVSGNDPDIRAALDWLNSAE